MITLQSPSMVLNDERAAVNYEMDFTRHIPATTSMATIVNFVLEAADKAEGGMLNNLVLTAHGSPGSFQLGTGLREASMGPFAQLRGRVAKIWFRGCLVARIGGSGSGAFPGANGHNFLGRFASLTECYVVASTELQASASARYPSRSMDTFEGLVLCYAPSGRISWQRRNPSVYDFNPTAGTVRLPNRE